MISWALILRARCAGCGLPISARYPLVEAATTLLFVLIGWIHLDGNATSPAAWGMVAVHCLLGSALLSCALIDWDLRVIPDVIDIPGMLLGPIALAAVPGILASSSLPDLEGLAARGVLHFDSAFQWWGLQALLAPLEGLASWLGDLSRSSPGAYRSLQGASAGVFGLVVGGGAMWVFAATMKRLLGRESLGFGDVKLTAMIGAFTGWQGVLVTLLIGSVLGSLAGTIAILRGRREESAPTLGHRSLPFGPFLVIGALIAALGGERALRALAL